MKKSLIWMVLIGITVLVLFNGCVVGEKGNQPPVVELRTPVEEATNQELDVVLEWNGQPGGGAARGSSLSILGYLVYFAVADQAYLEPEQTRGKSMEKTGLNPGTRYKWKVEVVQSDGQRSISGERFFTTKQRKHEAPQVELLLPANAATGQATELTLSWEATPGNQLNASARAVSLEGYFVYFGEQGEPYPEPQWVTRKSLQKEQLAYGTSYKWQVVAVQSDGQVATSTQNTFTTVHEAEYAAPSIQLLSPAHGATGQATRVTLSWQAQPGEVLGKEARGIWLLGYRVYLAREGESYAEPRWTENSQIQEPDLAYNTTYKWKVSVLQSDGQTTTSTERTFRTEQEDGAPQIELVSPADFATEQATTLTLSWEATPGVDTAGARAVNITGYELYFAKASQSYASPEQVTGKQLQKSNLEYATLYKWKVVAKQSDGKSAASEEWAFSTEQESYALPQVALQTPSHEATMVSLNPTLTWEATVGTQSNAGARAVNLENYEVYFAKVGEDYASPVITQAKSLGKVNLEPYTAYKWKVTANQSDGQQATTPEATFQTAVTFFMGNTLNSSLGDQNEKPVHGVVFTYDFELGKYEVTFDQYDAYLLATGQPTSTVNDGGWGRGSRPVMNVSWEDAVRYCNWLSDVSGFPRAYDETTWDLLDEDGATTTDITKVKGWRLPTEAEWEYCARGGEVDITDGVESHDYLYAGSDMLDDVGWYLDNSDTGSGRQTHPVGQKDPNELGLYDMSGNVWELCHDWYEWDWYAGGTQTNPVGPSVAGSGRVIRGGVWYYSARSSRVANRDYRGPSYRANVLGFRLSRTN